MRGRAAKEQRRIEGKARNEAWARLSPQQKLDDLDLRLGKGKGATRQRTKLAKVLSK